MHRPTDKQDIPGYVYVYCLEEHGQKVREFIDSEFEKMNKVLFIEDGALPWAKDKHITIDNLEEKRAILEKPWDPEQETTYKEARKNVFDYDALKFDEDDRAILMKIGKSKKNPGERVKRQEKLNSEKYMIVQAFYTKYHSYLEWALHKFLRKNRVVRPDLEDGKTEWFLIGVRELVLQVWKIRRAMQILFDDVPLNFYPEMKPTVALSTSMKKSKYTCKTDLHDNRLITKDSPCKTEGCQDKSGNQQSMKTFFGAPSDHVEVKEETSKETSYRNSQDGTIAQPHNANESNFFVESSILSKKSSSGKNTSKSNGEGRSKKKRSPKKSDPKGAK